MTNTLKESLLSILPRKENLKFLAIVDEKIVEPPIIYLLEKVVDLHYSFQYEKCHKLCQWILDFAWEKLNTGYWKDVAISWRYIYSYASLFKAISMIYSDSEEKNVIINLRRYNRIAELLVIQI